MDDLLLFLLKKGAHKSPVKYSTTNLAADTSMSQQNASRKLILLEKDGSIERTPEGISITKKGFDELRNYYLEIKTALEGTGKLKISGKIVEGVGDGKYYLGLKGYQTKIKEKLGFTPFAGTLNLRLGKSEIEKRLHLRELEPVIIPGFKEGERTFGDLFTYSCRIDQKLEGAILIPVRTHHGIEILEIIAPVELRKALNKKTGDSVSIKVT
ncbi:CTP-dependent riboflavin kinase [Candidatus Micrarchaeota archaeon]|nr:CTP-dependent riboflavin kinase [Candidatus Micrarchaeota archaeon]